jgi:MFS family permease
MLLSGCAVLVLGDLGVTLAGSVEMLYAMRVLEGIGYVAIAVAAVTMLTRTTQGARRTSALTLWSSFVPMSFALPLILAAQLDGTGKWRWAFTGHGIPLAALGIAAWAWLPTLTPVLPPWCAVRRPTCWVWPSPAALSCRPGWCRPYRTCCPAASGCRSASLPRLARSG